MSGASETLLYGNTSTPWMKGYSANAAIASRLLGRPLMDAPVDLEIAARHAREHVLVGLGAALEEAMPWRARLPLLHVSKVGEGRDSSPTRSWMAFTTCAGPKKALTARSDLPCGSRRRAR